VTDYEGNPFSDSLESELQIIHDHNFLCLLIFV